MMELKQHRCARTFTLRQLSELVDAELQGDGDWLVRQVASFKSAGEGCLSFFSTHRHRQVPTDIHSHAGALMVSPAHAAYFNQHKLLCDAPREAFARALDYLFPDEDQTTGVHPSARIAPSASISSDATIGAYCCVGARSVIEAGVRIGDGVHIGQDCRIGLRTTVHDGTLIYNKVHIGCDCIIHHGAAIGTLGFGYREQGGELYAIKHLGATVIGNQVDIGSLVNIDCGMLDPTIIEDHCKIDNQCHFGHNVHLGAGSVVFSGARIGGSCSIGKRCLISANAVLRDHLTLADHTHIDALTLMMRSSDQAIKLASCLPAMERHNLWRMAYKLKKL